MAAKKTETLEVSHTEEVESTDAVSSVPVTYPSNLLVVKTPSGKNVILKVVPQQSESDSPKTYMLKTAKIIKQEAPPCEIMPKDEIVEVDESQVLQYEEVEEEVDYSEDIETTEVQEESVIDDGTFISEHLFDSAIVTKNFDEEEVYVDEVTLEDNVNEVTIEENINEITIDHTSSEENSIDMLQ